jgi:DnaJ-class molecular chaperone
MNEKVWDRCANCHGTGKIHGGLRPKRRCPACGGTGYIQNSVLVVDMPKTQPIDKKTVLPWRQAKPKNRAKRG